MNNRVHARARALADLSKHHVLDLANDSNGMAGGAHNEEFWKYRNVQTAGLGRILSCQIPVCTFKIDRNSDVEHDESN